SRAEALTLMAKQPALDGNRAAFGYAHESTERALRPDHAVARDHERDGVRATGAADRPRRRAQLACKLAIGTRFADRDLHQRLPDSLPKDSSNRCERQRETELRIGEVALELAAGPLGERIGRGERTLAQGQIADSGDERPGGANAQHGERRTYPRRIRRRLDNGPRRARVSRAIECLARPPEHCYPGQCLLHGSRSFVHSICREWKVTTRGRTEARIA